METLRKIAELIEQNKTLEQRTDELKNIIVTNLTSNFEPALDYPSEIAHFSDARVLIVKFYQRCKIPMALYSDKGKLIYSIGWQQSFGTSFFEYRENYNNSTEPYHFFQQRNGIFSIAIPVEINKRQVATLIITHFFYCDHPITESILEDQAAKLNIDKELLKTNIDGAYVLPMTEINNIISTASFLAEMIAFIGQKNAENNIQIKKSTENNILLASLLDKIAEQESIIKTLKDNINVHQKEVRENTISKTAFLEQQNRLVKRIEQTENILNSLLVSVPLGIGFVRRQIFTYVNDQMFRIFGYTPKELIGRAPEMLFAQPVLYNEFLNSGPDGMQKKSLETLAVKRSGETFEVMVFVSYIDNLDPEHGIAISIMDISAIKKTQKQLLIAKEKAEESDRLKTAFLDNMSHEFRTPMNAIFGFTELLVSPYTSESQKKDFAKIIQNSGKKLLRLIDDIIDISKLASNQLYINKRTFFLKSFLTILYDDFNEFVINKHGNLVELILTNPNIHDIGIYNDDLRLRQVFNNILSNSLKFTSKGFIEFGYEIVGDDIQFYVRDTGKGIKKKYLPHVFERFRQGDDSLTREHGGTGLGLTLVKGIVELMGGKIWIDSKWGKGTTVYFTIARYSEAELEKKTIQHNTIKSLPQ